MWTESERQSQKIQEIQENLESTFMTRLEFLKARYTSKGNIDKCEYIRNFLLEDNHRMQREAAVWKDQYQKYKNPDL